LHKEHNISPEDLALFAVVDTVEDAVQHIENFFENQPFSPNF